MKALLALYELIDFVKSWLPDEHREKFWALAKRALDAKTASKLENTAALIHGANRYQRLRQEYEQMFQVVGQIAATCQAHDFKPVLPHFASLLRIREEFNAPLPTPDEISANMERQAEQRM